MLQKYICYLLLILLLAMLACQSENASRTEVYTIPAEEKLDSLNTWFSNDYNFSDKNYLPQFYKHFNQKLDAKQWENAAMLLFNTGQMVYVNAKADSAIIKTHIDFLGKHQNDISDRYKSGLYLNLGILYSYDSKLELSIEILKKVIEIPPRDYHTFVNISTAYNELSYVYAEIGQLDKALEIGFKAFDSSVLLKDTLGIGATYDAIGGIYSSMQDYENADLYFDKSFSMLSSIKNDNGVFTVFLNKVGLYEQINSPKLDSLIDLMFLFYQKNDFRNSSYKMYAYSWKAQQFLKEKKIAEAGKLLQEVRPIFDKSDEKFLYHKYVEVATSYDNATGYKTVNSNIYKEAIPEYKSGKNLLSLLTCYKALKDESIEKKDYKNALYYLEAYKETYDSLTSRSLMIKTKELDKKYQTEKKEQQIAIQKQELTQKNTYIALLVASLSGLLLAVFAFYSWQKQKLLKQEKTNSMNFTKQLLENTEDERKRIASDLHDSISHELLNLKSIFKQDLGVVNTKIDSIINDIRGISRNLHPVMFDKIGLVPNIEQLVERIQNQNNFFISTDISYAGTLTSADELQIYRIIQEALTNIIKYAKAHAAKITILEQKDKILIEIQDNGKGFEVKQALNSGKAFGLHNIIERSRVIGGEAEISSSSEGTIITIKIPKKL